MGEEDNEPSISWREHFRWVPGDPSEPTSTLVLTSRKRRFIDIRIKKPTSPDEPDLPNEGGPMTRLSWAFAGTSRTTLRPPSYPPPTLPASAPNPAAAATPVPHCVWTHIIDSTAAPRQDEQMRDEGDMYPIPDSARTLERGMMFRADTGREELYEEGWVDEVVNVVDGEDGRRGVVLELEQKDAVGLVVARGLVVRVGKWCQGLIKVVREEDGDVKAEVSCERWKWEQDGGWRRVAKLGRLWLPCAVTWEKELCVGREVVYGDWKWAVGEIDHW